MPVSVRKAVESDAESACDVVRRSIKELCVADHRNDRDTLDAWLENKTVAMFERLINAESKSCVVALRNDQICGFGHMNHTGEVGLLYVAPEARFLGASTLMLAWLEEQAAGLGLNAVFLNSSLTAKRFYEARGYVQTDDPTPGFGITSGWPMVKQLAL
jgi:N-acetylglutamate synthase-like GNAT family acetyltransferase